MTGKLKPLKSYLQTESKFATIRAQMQQNQASLGQVKKLLPTQLSDHCLGLVAKPNQLILYADSSAWASRLRYFSSELITKLRHNNLGINKISVKVVLDNRGGKTGSKERTAQFLSTENADFLQRVADHTQDPDLQAALRRLSLHRKNQK